MKIKKKNKLFGPLVVMVTLLFERPALPVTLRMKNSSVFRRNAEVRADAWILLS